MADFCRHHRIRKLALFGSVLRSDFDPDSDVDVLIELEPGVRMGFAFFGLPDELSPLFGGRRVDLGTFRSLSPHVRDRVLSEAVTVYAAAE